MPDGMCFESATPISIGRESFHALAHELPELWGALYRDTTGKQNLPPLEPNYDMYRKIENAGGLRVFAVRWGDTLVGVMIFFVSRNLHHASATWATCDTVWLQPDARKPYVAKRLIETAEEALRQEGVHTIQIAAKTYMPSLSRLLVSLGYDTPEITHQKVIAS